jgi:hypothetical protein
MTCGLAAVWLLDLMQSKKLRAWAVTSSPPAVGLVSRCFSSPLSAAEETSIPPLSPASTQPSSPSVGQRHPADEPREFAVLARPDDQVPVVGHDTVGQQPCSLAINGLFQNPLEGLVAPVILEDHHPRVGAIEHVVNQAVVIPSSRLSHGAQAIN